jgi:hypothetical protein
MARLVASKAGTRNRSEVDIVVPFRVGCAGPRFLNSNRRSKEANGESEQHEASECVDRDVYRAGHLRISLIITISCRYEFSTALIRAELGFRRASSALENGFMGHPHACGGSLLTNPGPGVCGAQKAHVSAGNAVSLIPVDLGKNPKVFLRPSSALPPKADIQRSNDDVRKVAGNRHLKPIKEGGLSGPGE